VITVPIPRRSSFLPRSGRDRAGVTVVRLLGELDVLDAPVLQARLRDIRWPVRPRIVVDLTGLALIDCACLGVLAGHARDVRALGGTLALAGPQGTVLRLLSVTGLLAWFEVHGTAAQVAAGRGRRSVSFPAPRLAPAHRWRPRRDPAPASRAASGITVRGS
jgi:anti-anti-sigma factor